MRRTALLAGILPFVSAFLGGVLALSLVVPSPATAQSSQLQEVRASAFTLVAPDGTVLASLAPAGGGGALLQLFDATTGNQRVRIAGAGAIAVLDPDGATTRFIAGYTVIPSPNGAIPPFSGVLLDPSGGAIGVLPASTLSASEMMQAETGPSGGPGNGAP